MFLILVMMKFSFTHPFPCCTFFALDVSMQLKFLFSVDWLVLAWPRTFALKASISHLIWYLVIFARLMGCVYTKHTKHTPGYEDPEVLSSETACEYIPANGSFCELYNFFFVFLNLYSKPHVAGSKIFTWFSLKKKKIAWWFSWLFKDMWQGCICESTSAGFSPYQWIKL